MRKEIKLELGSGPVFFDKQFRNIFSVSENSFSETPAPGDMYKDNFYCHCIWIPHEDWYDYAYAEWDGGSIVKIIETVYNDGVMEWGNRSVKFNEEERVCVDIYPYRKQNQSTYDWFAVYLCETGREGIFKKIYGSNKEVRPELGHTFDGFSCVYFEEFQEDFYDYNDGCIDHRNSDRSLFWDPSGTLCIEDQWVFIHYVDIFGNIVDEEGNKLVYEVDLEFSNKELFKGCDFERKENEFVLTTPRREAEEIIAANLAAMTFNQKEIIVKGPLWPWLYNLLARSLDGRVKRIVYKDVYGNRLTL